MHECIDVRTCGTAQTMSSLSTVTRQLQVELKIAIGMCQNAQNQIWHAKNFVGGDTPGPVSWGLYAPTPIPASRAVTIFRTFQHL